MFKSYLCLVNDRPCLGTCEWRHCVARFTGRRFCGGSASALSALADEEGQGMPGEERWS